MPCVALLSLLHGRILLWEVGDGDCRAHRNSWRFLRALLPLVLQLVILFKKTTIAVYTNPQSETATRDPAVPLLSQELDKQSVAIFKCGTELFAAVLLVKLVHLIELQQVRDIVSRTNNNSSGCKELRLT